MLITTDVNLVTIRLHPYDYVGVTNIGYALRGYLCIYDTYNCHIKQAEGSHDRGHVGHTPNGYMFLYLWRQNCSGTSATVSIRNILL